MLEVSIFPLSTILIFGIVLTVWHVFVFHFIGTHLITESLSCIRFYATHANIRYSSMFAPIGKLKYRILFHKKHLNTITCCLVMVKSFSNIRKTNNFFSHNTNNFKTHVYTVVVFFGFFFILFVCSDNHFVLTCQL